MLLSLFNRALLGAGLLATTASQPAVATLPAPGSEVPVQLHLTGSFTGVLLDQYTGRPLRHATVALMRLENEQLVAGAMTADNGEFRLDRATFGHYTLHVEVPGYEPLHEKITLAAGRDMIDLGSYGLIPLTTATKSAAKPMIALAGQP